MALENASVFLRLSSSGNGVTLSGDDLDETFTTSVQQVQQVINGTEEFTGFSRITDDDDDDQDEE